MGYGPRVMSGRVSQMSPRPEMSSAVENKNTLL